jgi:hypothetical protein
LQYKTTTMKKVKLYFSLLLMIGTLSTKGQTIKANIEFNFETKTFTHVEDLDQLKRGDWFRLTITSLNLNLYKVSIERQDSVIRSDIKALDFGAFNLDALTKLVGGVSSFATSAASAFPVAESIRGLNAISLLKDAKDFETATSKKPDEKEVQIKKRFNDEKKLLDGYLNNLKETKNNIEQLNLEVEKYNLRSNVEFVDSPAYAAIEVPRTFDFASAFTRIENARASLASLKAEVLQKNALYATFSEDNKSDIERLNLKPGDQTIKDAYSELLKVIDAALGSINSEKVGQLLTPLIFQSNNDGFKYVSAPLKFNGDYGLLKLTIAPWKEDLKLQTYTTQIAFHKDALSYFGIGVSFYFSGLFDESYSVKATKVYTTTDTSISYHLINENPTELEFGTAVLLRYGTKVFCLPSFGFHIAFGPAISLTNKIKPRVALTGGISFGKTNMLVIDGGLIVGYTDKLSKAFSVDDSYFEKPTQPTVSNIKLSWIFSVGYMYKF